MDISRPIGAALRVEMSTRTIRMSEGKRVSRLINALATVALTEYDSDTRFRAMATGGSKEAGLALLAKLDRDTSDLSKVF